MKPDEGIIRTLRTDNDHASFIQQVLSTHDHSLLPPNSHDSALTALQSNPRRNELTTLQLGTYYVMANTIEEPPTKQQLQRYVAEV
jgi:hypothetical protein